MKKPPADKIDAAFADGSVIDRALRKAVQDALQQHRQAGNPIAVWCDGKVVWIPPEEIPLPPDQDTAGSAEGAIP